MTADQFGGVVRAILAAAAGYAVAHGFGDSVTDQAVAGAICTAAVALWSYYTNRPAKVIPTKDLKS